jgi:hypothetical protein
VRGGFLSLDIAEKVVADRLAGRQLEQLDEGLERETCLNGKGMAKLNNTAQLAAEHVWQKNITSVGSQGL